MPSLWLFGRAGEFVATANASRLPQCGQTVNKLPLTARQILAESAAESSGNLSGIYTV
jgi:hypothetical protein